MNFLTCLRRLKAFLQNMEFFKKKQHCHHYPKISILIPFSSNNKDRKKNFQWLLDYWKHELPDAEIIVGKSHSKIFCKNEALNNAVKKSTGKVLVILDADAYLPGHVINKCADRILEELDNHLWYVPYHHLYRLTRSVSKTILSTNPKNPLRLPNHLPDCFIENVGHKSSYGNRYGAMIMMFPREALNAIGCFDERFKGWGGEDIALLRALDTLYGKHKITRNSIMHLWHPFIGDNYQTRVWEGQNVACSNSNLANRYHRATRIRSKMQVIVDEAMDYKKNKFNKLLYLICRFRFFRYF